VRSCSITKKLRVVRGGIDDYKKLLHYHYRSSRLGPFAAIFALKPTKSLGGSIGTSVVGVIVYTMPSLGLELRNIATDNLFTGFDRATHLALVNKNIRCIGRVIIEPRFRGLGLVSRLVRETMPKMNVAVIEAMAVMGLVNPFFKKAGMSEYAAAMPARCVQLIEAFSLVGVEKDMLIDPKKMQEKLEQLQGKEAEFVELEIRNFLACYGKRRNLSAGLERTRFVLGKLTFRPVYYIWFNPKMAFGVQRTKKRKKTQ